MADEPLDIADYRDAIESLLLTGEELEAAFPAASGPSVDSDDPRAIGITSHRLIVCSRELKRGSSDRWAFRSILFSQIEDIELTRHETFRRDRIDAWAAVDIQTPRAAVRLHYADTGTAREVHDRLLAHMLTLEARGLP